MVWLHGGAFNEGASYGPVDLYDGSQLASRGSVCVVGVNYRLGVLGFLASKQFQGNQAIQDQRAALRFVRDNIAGFGGDPGSVTLWGQSAGAMSVAVHLVSPPSRGLFHRALIESNVAAFRYQSHEHQIKAFGANFVARTPCKSLEDVECLLSQEANQTIKWGAEAAGSVVAGIKGRILDGGHILSAFAMEWSPVVGGADLPGQPIDMIRQGNFSHVPLLIGTVQDEGATFIYAGVKKKIPELLWPTVMRLIFGLKAGEKVISFYKASGAGKAWHDLRDSLSYVVTDYWFKCSNERIASSFSAAGLPVFLYRYDHVLSFPKVFHEYGLPDVCANRTCHASELFFVFNNYGNFTPTPQELEMSRSMGSYWTAFAHSSDPNSAASSRLTWPAFNTTARLNMRIAEAFAVESTSAGQAGPGVLPGQAGVCAFYDEHVGYDH